MHTALGRPHQEFEDEDEAGQPTNVDESNDPGSDEDLEDTAEQVVISAEQNIQVPNSAVRSSPETSKTMPGDPAKKSTPLPGQPKSDSFAADGNQSTGDSQPTEGSSKLKRLGIIGGVAAASCLTTVVAIPVVLSLAGFGAAGIVAGSVAAGWQAAIGNVAAGSFFAALQSAGVAGVATSTMVGVGAAGATGGAAIASVATKPMDQNGKTDEPCSSAPKPTIPPDDDDDDNNRSALGGAIVPSGKN